MRRAASAAGWVAALLAVAIACTPALAVEPDEILSDAQLETRARHISSGLRCLVCQNQSIDDSDADLAHDLRVLVRQRLVAGDSNEEVKQYIVARYGNYVLLKPPLDAETYVLWFGPLILLLGAAGTAAFFLRQRLAAGEAPPLTQGETQRLAALLEDGGKRPRDN